MLLVLCVLKVMLYFVSDYVKNVTMIVSLHKNFVENRFLFFFHSEMKKKTLSHLHFFNTLINKTFCKFSFGMIFLHFKCLVHPAVWRQTKKSKQFKTGRYFCFNFFSFAYNIFPGRHTNFQSFSNICKFSFNLECRKQTNKYRKSAMGLFFFFWVNKNAV